MKIQQDVNNKLINMYYKATKQLSFKEGVAQTYSGLFGIAVTLITALPGILIFSWLMGVIVRWLCSIFMAGFNLF